MEKKKNIKIGLVFIILIVILVIVGLVFAFNKKKNDNNSSKNTIEGNNTEKENSSDIGDYFILFNGSEIEKKIGVQYLDYIELNDENKKKYDIEYYNYEKGQYLGTADGNLGEMILENCALVEKVARVATSKEYDIVPRLYIDTSEIPDELTELGDYSSVNIRDIDLDGDGTNEYIACCTMDVSAGDSEDGKDKANTDIKLFDSEYNLIATLLTMDGMYMGEKDFLSLDDIDCLDIDNDGNMEIVINFPVYEGLGGLSIYRYNNGSIVGNLDYHVTLNP